MITTRRLVSLLVALSLICVSIPAVAQTTPTEPEYEPYDKNEFPQWARDLRRAEVVFIGSFPITLLLASLSYEAFRGIRDTVNAAPIEERSEFGSFSTAETRGLLVAGVSLSGVVTILDLILELTGRRREASGTKGK